MCVTARRLFTLLIIHLAYLISVLVTTVHVYLVLELDLRAECRSKSDEKWNSNSNFALPMTITNPLMI